MEIIEIKMLRGSCIICLYLFLDCCFSTLSFSGGILGWDPVHTTCIPDEMMMRL